MDFAEFDVARAEWEASRGQAVSDSSESVPTTKGIVGGQQPDIPASVIVALVQQVIAVAVAFGAPITETQSIALVGMATVIGSVLMYVDLAKLRPARNQRASTDTINALVNGVDGDDD